MQPKKVPTQDIQGNQEDGNRTQAEEEVNHHNGKGDVVTPTEHMAEDKATGQVRSVEDARVLATMKVHAHMMACATLVERRDTRLVFVDQGVDQRHCMGSQLRPQDTQKTKDHPRESGGGSRLYQLSRGASGRTCQ